MTDTEKTEAVNELLRIVRLMEGTPTSDVHEILRLCALAHYQLQKLTAQ